jgi:drug/metabolite transporter (DMT)-like permease
VLSSVVILGEELGPNTVVGAIAVIAGLWLIQRPSSDARSLRKRSEHLGKSTDSLKSPA